MGYDIKEIAIEDVDKRTGQYSYALMHMMSSVYFGKASDITINWEELLEARFFSENKEMHIFKCGNQWKAVELSDTEDSEVIVKNYEIAAQYKNIGRQIRVKEYLAEDEDGQVYVKYTRLCGVE